MELGEKLRKARLEAGLSQRQLCGDAITRNMLSQIEHGTAKPSMDTLKALAARLGKPVSYFLEDTAVVSPNQEIMASARRLYDAQEYAQSALVLESYRAPDETYDREHQLLEVLLCMNMAEAALAQGREPYARELLEKAAAWQPQYCREALERRRLLLLGRIRGQNVSGDLPSLDEELLLRAEEAIEENKWHRAGCLLDAAEDTEASRWNLLRGEVFLAEKKYPEAAQCFHRAEQAFSCFGKLETCYREMGDYKQAYAYARKQKCI